LHVPFLWRFALYTFGSCGASRLQRFALQAFGFASGSASGGSASRCAPAALHEFTEVNICSNLFYEFTESV
jgi:hypothetical protein